MFEHILYITSNICGENERAVLASSFKKYGVRYIEVHEEDAIVFKVARWQWNQAVLARDYANLLLNYIGKDNKLVDLEKPIVTASVVVRDVLQTNLFPKDRFTDLEY